MSKLVIIESPGKIKAIKKYLGSDYEVVASAGHIRDLPKSSLAIDVEHNFAPKYVNMSDKKDVIKKLKELSAQSEYVYLATDPDREGEAISWHLAQILSLDMNENNRVVFNEITKTGVQNGMSNPRSIDINMVDAQQARRVLDRLVGYKLSPFLWKKVKRGLSAGRVQSVALWLIVEREKEIRNFVPVEYWTINANLKKDRRNFIAKFYGTADGKKLELNNEIEAKTITDSVANKKFVVTNVKNGTRTKQPAPPFTTSTLQQEAARKLGYTGQRTMKIAQKLYEGIDLAGRGAIGLITYMRTDSLRISEEARSSANAFISKTFGDSYLPKTPRYFKTKKNVQDAHEAIRPTNVEITPEEIKNAVTAEQYKLYKLIWERFVASLMAACVQNTTSVELVCDRYLFKSSGYKVKFDGYTKLYVEGKDEDDEDYCILPELAVGDEPSVMSIVPEQHFTAPPPRYNEPTLIKTLDQNGVGRPSTYAPIIANILQREYIERVAKALKPTPLGEAVSDLMSEYFKKIVDVKFTAGMEDSLDKIESGDLNWVETISEFYEQFEKTLVAAEKNMDGKHVKVPDTETDVVCDLCGRKMVIKSGRFGKFLACPGYPECKNTKPIVKETTGVCPNCDGKMVERKSKTGHKYFSCSNYPKCKFMTWDDPTAQICPQCGKTLFRTKGKLHCLADGCGYEKETKRSKKTEDKSENNEN